MGHRRFWNDALPDVMGAFRTERNHCSLAEPRSVLLARQARARGGLCHRDPPIGTTIRRMQNCRRTVSIPQILLHSGHQHPEDDDIVLAQDVELAYTRSYGSLRVRFDCIRPFADSISW